MYRFVVKQRADEKWNVCDLDKENGKIVYSGKKQDAIEFSISHNVEDIAIVVKPLNDLPYFISSENRDPPEPTLGGY